MAQTSLIPTTYKTPQGNIITSSGLPGELTRIPFIIGGTPASPNAYPWMGALVEANEPNGFLGQFSGGTVIHPQWVLTAAHSIINEDGTTKNPEEVDFLLRSNTLTEGGIRYDVDQILRHPNYQSETFDSDLALLRLTEPLVDLDPLALVTGENAETLTAPDTTGTVLGWGLLSPSGPAANELQEAQLSILSNDQANEFWGGAVNNNMIAAVGEGIQGPAPGDSGGPLLVPDGDTFAHGGVVSFGTEVLDGETPTVFTRTSVFANWINNQTSPDDLQPGIYLSDATLKEGNGQFSFMEFTVRVVGVSEGTFSVDYRTADGTAIAGQDYLGETGTLDFTIEPPEVEDPPEPEDPENPPEPEEPPPPPDVFQTIEVAILGDTAFESDKSFSLELDNFQGTPTDLALQKETGIGRIVDDDPISETLPDFRKQDNSKNPFFQVTAGAAAVPTFIDFDLDGDLDAFAGTEIGNLFFFENQGTATDPDFAFPEVNPFEFTPVSGHLAPTVGDIDNDGDLDILGGDANGDLLLADNIGTITNPQYTAPQSNPFNLVNVGGYASPIFVDIDRDGDLDVFTGNEAGNILFFENTGTENSPQFADPETNPFGLIDVGSHSRITFGDINGDGDLDALVGNEKGTNLLFLNTGTPTTPTFVPVFTEDNPLFGRVAGYYTTPTFTDLDGDDDNDIFVGNQNGELLFFENIGPDSDGDTVPDDLENTVGDRNEDGIQDSQQANVVSFAPFVSDDRNPDTYLTFAAPPDDQFTRLEVTDQPLFNAPLKPSISGLEFPLAYVDFTLALGSGTRTTLDVILPEVPAQQNYNTFWQLNPSTAQWSALTDNGTTGARFFDLDNDGFADRMLLTLEDGGRGDEGGSPDGNILNFGAIGTINQSLTLTADESQIFTVQGPSGTALANISLQPSDNDRITEVGFVRVDANNRVDGVAPGEEGFTQAALSAGEKIYNVLTDASDELMNNIAVSRRVSVAAGDRLMFYLVENGTKEGVLKGRSDSNVFFSFTEANFDNFDHVEVTEPSQGNFTLGWEDFAGGGDLDFNDTVIDVSLENRTPSLNQLVSALQTENEGEVLDFRFLAKEEVRVSFPRIESDAKFENTVGLYQVENEAGAVRDPVTGQVVSPGSGEYTLAAIRQSQVNGMSFTETQQGVSDVFAGGKIFAPFIIADGTVQDVLEGNSEVDTYFAFLNANPDGLDHVLLLGENVWGFEDLPQAGDRDFNDIIMQAEIGLA
ncbi:trypsin-like serine protease [Spirulina sp. CS-785/01]|uniref:trypsin-like serine protease n=1 Tax=Spirulina sp. CS-785/01 TaxID=3021716 RepID=UPI00232DA5EE|nr:trypsin-like serine protease [Spirulina sp. CS-785/01]MDB9312055.1 trypsin-like serine protease [Spirulina sp. CS-785/01]